MPDLPYYQSLSPDERARVMEVGELLAEDGLRWFAPVASLLPERNFRNIGPIIAAAGAPLEAEALTPCSRFCMWMYLLDYYADEVPGVTVPYLEELHGRVESVLAGTTPADSPKPFLETSLQELLTDLAASPAAPALLAIFKGQIIREIAGTRTIRSMSQRAAAGQRPTMDQFLVPATQCVNHISCSMSLLFSLGAPLSDRDVELLHPALLEAARAVRLANDLRTHGKDDAEGLLHCLSFGWTPEQVTGEIQASLTRCNAALDQAITAGGPARSAEALRRLTRIGVEIYGVTDIRYEL